MASLSSRPPVTDIHEFFVCIEAIWSGIPDVQIQNPLPQTLPRRIKTRIAIRGGFAESEFSEGNIDFLLCKCNHLFVPIQVVVE